MQVERVHEPREDKGHQAIKASRHNRGWPAPMNSQRLRQHAHDLTRSAPGPYVYILPSILVFFYGVPRWVNERFLFLVPSIGFFSLCLFVLSFFGFVLSNFALSYILSCVLCCYLLGDSGFLV